MKENLTELMVILDASGSMFHLIKDTIGGYNALIEEQRKLEGDINVSLITFDTSVKDIYVSKDIKEIDSLTGEEYVIGGMTALYDAIGIAINKLENKIESMNAEDRPENVMVVITTDGEENSSKEFNKDTIKELISKKEKDGWEILFIGANIDSFGEAKGLGISGVNASNYIADSQGTKAMYRSVSRAVSSLREDGSVDKDWAEELNKK